MAPFFYKEQLENQDRGKGSFCFSIKFPLVSTACTEMPRNCPGYSLAAVGTAVYLSPDCPCAQASLNSLAAVG